MAERRCTFKCGDWNCGSYQFNLYKADIDQGDLCDVHYWQTKAQREWVGLTDAEIDEGNKQSWVTKQAWESAVWWASEKLKEKNT